MYPLQDGYIPKIDDFLDDINQRGDGIDIRTSNMSTRLFGDYDHVSSLLSEAMKRSMQKHGKVVFVCKFIEAMHENSKSLILSRLNDRNTRGHR